MENLRLFVRKRFDSSSIHHSSFYFSTHFSFFLLFYSPITFTRSLAPCHNFKADCSRELWSRPLFISLSLSISLIDKRACDTEDCSSHVYLSSRQILIPAPSPFPRVPGSGTIITGGYDLGSLDPYQCESVWNNLRSLIIIRLVRRRERTRSIEAKMNKETN